MTMIQVGIVSIAGTLLAIQFKGGKSEYSIYISAVISLFVFVCILNRLADIIAAIETIRTYLSMDIVYIETLIKMIGITYIAEFSSSICKDAGYQAIASQIEVFGKLSILALSMPILITLLETIQQFLS
ncbi:MAG: SpoIIIAC/SpoIIIAD family protein [Lachnospiraceae bacterium]